MKVHPLFPGPALTPQGRPRVLIIDSDITPGDWLMTEISRIGGDPLCHPSVDSYLTAPIPGTPGDTAIAPAIILVDADVFDPNAVGNIRKLQTSLGPRSACQIIAMTSFCPGAFDVMLQQAGCQACVSKTERLEHVIGTVAQRIAELRQSAARTGL